MRKTTTTFKGYEIDIYSLNTAVIGSGAAGFNAADSLHDLGVRDIAVITEGVGMGTSRNAGSDKQTYYKLSTGGEAPDSVSAMAKTLYGGGSMHGDIAFIEAASSARSFYKLVNIGVPFPHNRYGEYVGYKTDHDGVSDPMRAVSAGPLTSKFMTEKLEEQVRRKRISILDGFLVIGIITDRNTKTYKRDKTDETNRTDITNRADITDKASRTGKVSNTDKAENADSVIGLIAIDMSGSGGESHTCSNSATAAACISTAADDAASTITKAAGAATVGNAAFGTAAGVSADSAVTMAAGRGARLALFNCTNVIYATGGPAGMYLASAYPENQTGALGIAFEAGAKGVNLTESQYGIASVKYRWNLSGTYQQVIPRYISTNAMGEDEQEFLREYFDSPGKMMDAIFLKGYQWPFDPGKVEGYGSSLIDLLVYNEIHIKGRRVFLDYTRNPSQGSVTGRDCSTKTTSNMNLTDTLDKKEDLHISLLGEEARTYLQKSGAVSGVPFDRLSIMNMPAISLFKEHGIDLEHEPLEIDVCAQHCNGGLAGNIWWESNLRHFFPVGEANGTFGVKRPGGSALNSTQTGSLRAAQYIAAKYRYDPLCESEFLEKALPVLSHKVGAAQYFAEHVLYTSILKGKTGETQIKQSVKNNAAVMLRLILDDRRKMQERMTKAGAHIRKAEEVEETISNCAADLYGYTRQYNPEITVKNSQAEKEPQKAEGCSDRYDMASERPAGMDVKLALDLSCSWLPEFFRNYDILLTQYVFLSSIREYIQSGGGSRGSYIIYDAGGKLPESSGVLPEIFRSRACYTSDNEFSQKVCETSLNRQNSGALNDELYRCIFEWKYTRPLPDGGGWFEDVWKDYRSDSLYY